MFDLDRVTTGLIIGFYSRMYRENKMGYDPRYREKTREREWQFSQQVVNKIVSRMRAVAAMEEGLKCSAVYMQEGWVKFYVRNRSFELKVVWAKYDKEHEGLQFFFGRTAHLVKGSEVVEKDVLKSVDEYDLKELIYRHFGGKN